MGVVSECCCKEVYYIDILIIIITFPYSTCISSFFGSIIDIPISLFIFKMFFHSCLYIIIVIYNFLNVSLGTLQL